MITYQWIRQKLNNNTINVYCDESHIVESRYLLIGGIWTTPEDEVGIRKSLSEFRQNINWQHEFKWNKVSKTWVEKYKKLIDIFFASSCSFHCIVIDQQKLDHATYNQGDKELGFYKFYYQLLSRKVVPNKSYFVFTDHRQNRNSSRLSDLKKYLDRYSLKYHSTVKKVEPKDSKNEDLIQLADILLGAVGYRWNILNGANSSKIEVCKYIESFGMRLRSQTLPSEEKFNIWLFKSKKRPGS